LLRQPKVKTKFSFASKAWEGLPETNSDKERVNKEVKQRTLLSGVGPKKDNPQFAMMNPSAVGGVARTVFHRALGARFT